MIYISNDIYLNAVYSGIVDPNYPLIGWRGTQALGDFYTDAAGDEENISALWSPDTYTFWQASILEDRRRIIMANPTLQAIDYIGVAGHNWTGYQYRIQTNTDGNPAGPWTTVVDWVQVIDGNAIMTYFNEVQTPYISIEIFWAGGPPDFIRAAHVRSGRVLRCARKMYVGVVPFTLNKRVEKIVTVSDSGKYLGGLAKSVSNRYELNQPDNKPAFVRAEVDPFLDHCELLRPDPTHRGPVGTFFAAWRPGEYPLEVLYCHPPEQINRPRNQRNNGMMEWSISGEGEAWQSV